MINPNIYGKAILNAFLNTADHDDLYVDDPLYAGKIDPSKRNRIFFGVDVYIGLLTKIPTGTDLSWEEPTAPEYQRFKLSRLSTTMNIPILSSHISEEPVPIVTEVTEDGKTVEKTDYVKVAYVINDDDIIFPEAYSSVDQWGGAVGEETGKIVGFGIFDSDEKDKDPFFWGEVKSEDGTVGVEIKQNEVPIIRIGGFKITAM